jgi:hypothetical protein
MNNNQMKLVRTEYETCIGEAGDKYMRQFEFFHGFPATFRWHELWSAMLSAAPSIPPVSDGNSEAVDNELEAFAEGGDKSFFSWPSRDDLIEEIQRLESYEEGLNQVINWLRQRELYWEGDYQDEGADFDAILTEHEEIIVQQLESSTASLQAENKRLLEALKASNKLLYRANDYFFAQEDKKHLAEDFGVVATVNGALITDIERKGE